MGLISKIFGGGDKIKNYIDDGAIVVDVRTKEEFASGHVPQSKNFPLESIGSKVNTIKSWEKPVIVCCASGMRSGRAKSILADQGINVINGGGWRTVERVMNA